MKSKSVILLFSGWILSLITVAQDMPDTEIFLVQIRQEDGQWTAANLKNISNNKGYDSQPYFDEKESLLYFSSQFPGKNNTDIRTFNFETNVLKPFCESPESEFSPCKIPGSNHISSVRIELDSTQRLWDLDPVTCQEVPLFAETDSVGYYTWIEKGMAAMFLITDPPTLVLVKEKSKPEFVVSGIGRCIKKIPGQDAISFVQKIGPQVWVIRSFDLKTKKFKMLVQTPGLAEDYEWLPDGTILMGIGPALYSCQPFKNQHWTLVQDFNPTIENITRIMFIQGRNQIAIAGILPKLP